MLYIGNVFPDAPVYGIGFSLGAGMLTKYLGQFIPCIPGSLAVLHD